MGHNENEIDPVVVENGSFTWDDEGNTAPILKNISMKVNYYFLIICHLVINKNDLCCCWEIPNSEQIYLHKSINDLWLNVSHFLKNRIWTELIHAKGF